MNFTHIAKLFFIGTPILLAIDFLWIGLIANSFYKSQLADVARMTNGSLTPFWPTALAVYVCIGLGLILFVVLPHADKGLWTVLAYGAFFGFVTYGIYDFTNHATLKSWSATMVAVDIAWGMAINTIGAALFYGLHRWLSE